MMRHQVIYLGVHWVSHSSVQHIKRIGFMANSVYNFRVKIVDCIVIPEERLQNCTNESRCALFMDSRGSFSAFTGRK